MATRSMTLAALVAVAMPLAAGTVLAQGTGGTGTNLGGTYRMEHPSSSGGEQTGTSMPKKAGTAPMHAAKPHHAKVATVPAGSTTTNQLNDMSFAASKQNQSFAPTSPMGDTTGKKKTM